MPGVKSLMDPTYLGFPSGYLLFSLISIVAPLVNGGFIGIVLLGQSFVINHTLSRHEISVIGLDSVTTCVCASPQDSTIRLNPDLTGINQTLDPT